MTPLQHCKDKEVIYHVSPQMSHPQAKGPFIHICDASYQTRQQEIMDLYNPSVKGRIVRKNPFTSRKFRNS